MYGLRPPETPDWSPGELLAVVQAGRRREQHTAVMLHTHAALCRAAFGGKFPAVFEAFPLWTQEEVYNLKAQRLREQLMQHTKG